MIKKILKNLFFIGGGLFLIFFSFILILFVSNPLPDFKSFETRKNIKTTKIYDRTGKIVLFDLYNDVKKTYIPLSEMGVNIKNATIAIEDSDFYQHKGIKIKSIIRAFWKNVIKGDIREGGSTITQQILKNTLLTKEKTIIRKFREWILAVQLENFVNKDKILEAYLNEAPYGGVIYGIYEASQTYFGKEPKELSLAEVAYLAALPKAPSYYSPYGSHKEELDKRKNIVLKRMYDLNFINQEEYQRALSEEIKFLPQKKTKIKAPHFVFYIYDLLKDQFGKDVLEKGYKVITSLDIDLQEKAEEIVKRIAYENEKNFNGKNASLVALNPKTGEILAMVGSRDYFEEEIDGAYNTALAKRQPGSAFKPFIYAASFLKGYTPDTILFDVKTEFQTTCDPYGRAYPGKSQKNCYHPNNYDGKFRGPLTVREALAQSINVPAVQMLYLVGVENAIRLARDMGINTLKDPNHYGLTLVIGGGEVTLLDMTSAYGVFANNGIKSSLLPILKVEDEKNNLIKKYQTNQRQVLDKNVALMINDILSDNKARTPTFGANSVLRIDGPQQVMVKTGTTNNNRDAWTIGCSPSLCVGVWVGNNDNTPMKKGGVALAGPIWNAFMKEALKNYPEEYFEKPVINYPESLPPILRGIWLGGETFVIDKISRKLATEYTPPETREEIPITNPHSILYWIDKENPTVLKVGGNPNDPQLKRWEIAVADWWQKNKQNYQTIDFSLIPQDYDDVHVPEKFPNIEIISPSLDEIFKEGDLIKIKIINSSFFPLRKIDIFFNDNLLKTLTKEPWEHNFYLKDLNIQEKNYLKFIVQDVVLNSKIFEIPIKIDFLTEE